MKERLKPDESGSPDIENLLFAGFKMYHPCLPCDALTSMRGGIRAKGLHTGEFMLDFAPGFC